jgi:Dolichyl-phosphate-mannose-protein mannosyltransferase
VVGQSSSSKWKIGLLVVLLLVAFWITTADLQRDSLWTDEAWTAWAVQPPYLRDTLERVRGDVHPPLYFLLLNLWGRVEGDSVFALRLPSALVGIIALAATFAVGRRLFDYWTGVLALAVLGTASFFVYYTREARMYMLLLALAALSMLLYLRWRDRPSWVRALLYALSMALMLYTHYAGALVIATQLIHLVVTAGKRFEWRQIIRWILPYLLALLAFLPWLPIFLTQMRDNPNGPLAIPVPTDWAAVEALLLILTSANWGWYVLPFVLGKAIPSVRHYRSALFLLLAWLLLTPITLLALNAWVTPVYQVRYAIAMLPAGALLVAYGLRHMGLPNGLWTRYRVSPRPVLVIAGVVIIACTQLTMYPEFWAEKPTWEATIRQMVAARHLLEPTITDLAPYSPAAYYDRHLHIRQGIGLDLSWRLHSAAEARTLADIFKNEPSVWVALPVNTAKTWHIVSELDKTRHVGYRSSLSNMIFYRFDQGNADDLQFRFGDLLRYVSGQGADQQFWVYVGDDLCVNMQLTALHALDGSYSAGLHLVDLSGTSNAAGWDGGLGSADAGQAVKLTPCMTVPPDTAPGHYHLELVVYNWATLERLPVIEDGAGDGLPWQDVLMLAAADVLAK